MGTSPEAPRRWIDDWFGASVDASAVDARRLLPLRLVITLFTGGLIGVNLGFDKGLAWLTVAIGAEALAWAVSLPVLRGEPGERGSRICYVFAVTIGTLNWSLAALMYWFSGETGLQFVAIVVACGHLFHAQAFSYRSRALFLINAGVPAANLATIVLVLTPMSMAAWVSAALGVGMTLGYVLTTALASRRAADTLARSRQELEQIAYSDSLTALANRRRFAEDVRLMIARSRQTGSRFALVLIDLDRLKETNDQMGHDAGDALLVATADRLRSLIGAQDRIARLGGDEFALLIADIGDGSSLAGLCSAIIDILGQPLDFNGATLGISSSIGVAIHPDHGTGEATLYKAADVALYAAKDSGRNAWRAFVPPAPTPPVPKRSRKKP